MASEGDDDYDSDGVVGVKVKEDERRRNRRVGKYIEA